MSDNDSPPREMPELVMADGFGDKQAMSSLAHLIIHSSQFPDQIRVDLIESLRARRINQKFHYDSVKQVRKWLALHEAFSPARRDPDCLAAYARCFERMGRLTKPGPVCVISLGCGGGQKDAQLITRLIDFRCRVDYLPVDVGAAMVLTARETALRVLPADRIRSPLVCDLATADDLADTLSKLVDPRCARLVAFFGMIPNFEPRVILPRLSALLRPGEWLLLSANLAPGPEYATGVARVLPQYDNTPTRDWLMTLLLDLGIEAHCGRIHFKIESGAESPDLLRIAADFQFVESCEVGVDEERFIFEPGDQIRLFYSYRYTPDKIASALNSAGIEIKDQWHTDSAEEGVFLCRRH